MALVDINILEMCGGQMDVWRLQELIGRERARTCRLGEAMSRRRVQR